jgi:hypothetical protein
LDHLVGTSRGWGTSSYFAGFSKRTYTVTSSSSSLLKLFQTKAADADAMKCSKLDDALELAEIFAKDGITGIADNKKDGCELLEDIGASNRDPANLTTTTTRIIGTSLQTCKPLLIYPADHRIALRRAPFAHISDRKIHQINTVAQVESKMG